MQNNPEFPPIRLSRQRQVIDAAGFKPDWRHGLYIHRGTKKAFSIEFMADHTAEEIEACIAEPVGGDGWRFYFNAPPCESVREQLEEALA